MKDVLVDTEGFNQYYEELNRLKDLSLSIASIGSESYADAVGDGWHDNFAFEDTMRESRKIASRINKMLEDEKYLKIVDKLPEIDADINQIAMGWSTERMSKVDLTIIRLAIFEIKYDDEVPTGVAINEAVELAKRYGQDESSVFVNGILAKFA